MIPQPVNPPHPHLPDIDRVHTAADVNRFGREDRGPDFYLACLHYAQSLWQSGLPAQSILQCNRALSCLLAEDEPVLRAWPPPYLAIVWILQQRPAGQFIGNPRRHWQHLATRMSGQHKGLRVWRAWACWSLAKSVLPETEFPADWQQIRTEGVVEPEFNEIVGQLKKLAPAGEVDVWLNALQATGFVRPAASEAKIRVIGPDELGAVTALARRIWNSHYPGIISQAQIDYMLAVWYQDGALAREMRDRGAVFALIEQEGEALGYLGFEPQAEDVLFISKLYLLPAFHGRGLGRQALDWLRNEAQARAARRLRLRVNKNNAAAIRAYQRAGFTFVEDVCTDIGSGFVMDDYLMERPV